MKQLVFTWILILLGMSSNAQDRMQLEWTFFHPLKSEWMTLGTKGSVQEALIALGEMPDPYYGTNELKFGWIEEHTWEFKSIFFVDSTVLKKEYSELLFNNIDTYGKIYLNDSLILETDNAFIPHSVQAKKYLKPGLNELTVVITPPILYHADMWKNKDYQLPAPNDAHDTAVAPYTRKPQYQFGWDWALRMNTVGFNKPVELLSYNKARLVNKTVNIVELKDDEAIVDFTFFLNNEVDDSISVQSRLFGNEMVKAENGVIKRRIRVEDPRLWWPRGQGEPEMYYDEVQLIAEDGSYWIFPVDFGIKTSELVTEADQWGTSYYFKINGRKIFCKGGDYIPQDIFPARVKDEDIVEMVETMAASNFNMVRVWGGGYYPDDIFFETCDQLGIMVWEDFMFACSMYPGDSAFLENVRKEFEYQVPRIAGHPSVVQFNGNNEVEVAWGNWGFQIKYGLYGKSAKEIEASYDALFKQLAPEVVEKYSSVPYIHTSPLSNWGKMELYNHGSQHYWGVWHGKDPIEDFGKKIGRFNAEYGFQSFPEYSTLHTFSEEKDWDLSSEVMEHHQKSYVGNNMILKHAKKLYGKPENFEEFVYYSQLTQAMAVSMAVAGHRIDFPRCGGTLYWQLNDCWPGPTWSSLDYYGNWKALQYRIRDDYEDVTVVEKYNSLEDVDYYLVSGVVDTFECTVTCRFFDFKGHEEDVEEFSVAVNGQQSYLLNLESLESKKRCKKKKTNRFIEVSWNDASGMKYSRTFERIGKEYRKATEKDIELSLAAVDAEKGKATLIVTNKRFLRNAWVYYSEGGIKFDRNFNSLLPGTHEIQIEFETVPDLDKFDIRWL